MLPLLFTKDTRWKFIEVVQNFEDSLSTSDPLSSPLAICSSLEKVEQTELQSFSLKLESQSNPENEKKRFEFWIVTIKKFSDQLRQLSLYSDDKKTHQKPKN